MLRSYGGRVPLPRARLDSVLAHLEAHSELYQSMYTYPENEPGFELQAGLGPGGLVWLLGEQYQMELARAHLPVVPTTWPKPAGVDPNAPFTSAETELPRRPAVLPSCGSRWAAPNWRIWIRFRTPRRPCSTR
ncbi:MAG: hypothetical protein ACRYG7_50010 [Janthinobacterium lividum]